MKDNGYSTISGAIIMPHSSVCQYPACADRRVGATLFCAGHELLWRANYTITSERGDDNQRHDFYKPYWEKCHEETLEMFRRAGVPPTQQAAVRRAYAEAAERLSSSESSRDVVDISIPQEIGPCPNHTPRK